MTFSAFKMLRAIKKAQISEDNLVDINYTEDIFITAMVAKDEAVRVSLAEFDDGFNSTIDYLVSEGLMTIDADFRSRCQLTHRGFHIVQTMFTGFLKFLVKSVAVPIAVSLVTTLIALWLSKPPQ
ncbi:hypothetical protein LJC07_04585 [Christensenellaceae bacterium OttesenSCG-928-L17]|nr:hypothetical protein [Christensenellaceae bacterium OttesenSCG-928-L17]